MRKEVKWFAEQMEEVLRQNDGKRSWKWASLQYLSMRLTQERKELAEAIKNKNSKETIKECVDVANFAMMIAEKNQKKMSG